MEITLIYPSITGCGFNSYGQGHEGSWISHGLCSISAYIKQKSFDVNLIDLRRLEGWGHFRDEIVRRKPDVVGITMMSVDYGPAMKCIKIIKETAPSVKTVVGGPHPSLVLDEMVNKHEIDYIIVGEGEISFCNLLEDIESGKETERIIQGIKPALDRLPFVDRELFGSHEMPFVDFLPRPFVTLIAGRGCIYNCSFCQPAERLIFGRKVRRRNVNNVIKELSVLRQKYHFRSMMLHDDCLTEDRTWIEEFCAKYKEKGFSQPFVCQSRADVICKDEEMVKKMKDARLVMFIIGFESGNQRILNFLRKGTTVEQNYKAAEICHRYNIKIWANYMMGIPTETKEEVMDTVKMIKKIKPYRYSQAFYTPHPGSDLYTYCLENNLSLITNHSDYRRNPRGAKIRGVDYKFLQRALLESMNLSFEQQLLRRCIESPSIKIIGKCLRRFKPADWVIKRLLLRAYR